MRQQSTSPKTTDRPRGRPPGPRPRKEPVAPLLYDRKRTAQLLSISEATLIAMENAGTLHAVKLNRSENGKTFYRASDIHTLAENGVTLAEGEGE